MNLQSDKIKAFLLEVPYEDNGFLSSMDVQTLVSNDLLLWEN